MDYSDPKLFDGIRFHLAGFQPAMRDKVKKLIVSYGGVHVSKYSQDCTHVIVYKLLLDDPICVAARRDGKTLVTSSWIDRSIETGEQANTSSIVYRPPKELSGIPGAEKLVISLTGYRGIEREYIMTMVGLIGAEFSKAMNPFKITHLICYKFEGEKYVAATRHQKIKFINHQWLEDCLKAWKILPEEHYSKSSYELEMMEAVVNDSEDETKDCPASLSDRGVINAFNDTAIASNVSTPPVQGFLNNVSKDEVMLPLKPEQMFVSKNLHKIDKHQSMQQNLGEQSGKLVGPSSKRPADSVTDYCSPSKSRKTAKKSNVSEGKPVSSNRKLEYLQSDEVWEAKIESQKKVSTSDLFGVAGTKAVLLDEDRQCALPEFQKLAGHSNVSPTTPKSQKLMATAFEKVDASGLSTSVSGSLQKSKDTSFITSSRKGLETVRASEEKSPNVVLCRSMASEKLQAGKSDMDTRIRTISSNASCTSPDVKNKKTAVQNLPESLSFSPDNKKLEASNPPRTKMVGRKSMDSMCKAIKKTAHAQKGSLRGNFSKIDAALPLTGQIEGKEHVSSSVADELLDSHKVDGSDGLKFEPLDNSTAGIIDYTDPINDAANTYKPEMEHAKQPLGKKKGVSRRAKSKTVINPPKEVDQDADANVVGKTIDIKESENANTYKPELEHAKQPLAQKKGVSRRATSKTVINPPKEVDQDAYANVVGKTIEIKESENGKTMASARKKRRGGQSLKGPVQAENETVASDKTGTCSVGQRLGNYVLKKRRETLLLNHSDTPEMEKDGQHDGRQPEKFSGTSNSTEVVTEADNESHPYADNGLCAKKGGKHTGKKRRGTLLLTKSNNLISVEKENLLADGQSGNLSGKSNGSIVGNDGVIEAEKIVGKRRRGTHVLNKAGKLDEAETENESKGEATKSNLTVRENNAISSDSLTIHSDLTEVKKEPVWFIVSGHRLQRKEFHQLIKRLKGKHCRDSHQWSYQATHFIVPDPLRRTEKFFAAAASGRWILKTDYLTASTQAGEFLPEEPYEWHKNGLSEDGAINLEAPRKWRLLREKTGHGAFYGMHIIVYGDCIAPPLDTLKRAVKAGDGTILATSPPYTRLLNSGVDFAIVTPGMPRVDIWVQEFLKHEIPCVSADYLVEYVCKPGYPLDRHVQYNTHEWAEKSFARLSNLLIDCQ